MQANGRWTPGLGIALLALFAACGGGTLGSTGTGGAGGGILTGGGGGIATGSGGGIVTGSGGAISTGTGGAGAGGGSPGGSPLVTGPANSAWDIAVDATHVYWTDRVAQAVMKIPKEGGTPVTLASGQSGVSDLAVDSNFVYWTNSLPSGSVMKMSIGGGAPVAIATGQLFPTGIAVDATNAYWTSSGGSTLGLGSVMKASLATGANVTLAADQEAAIAIAIDATSIYWTKGPFESGGGEIMTMPIAGGTPMRLAQLPYSDAAASSSIGTSIAVDGESVYFIHHTRPMATGEQTSMLKKVPRAGGPVTQVAASRSIVVVIMDGSILTWASTGAILRRSANTTTYVETTGQARRIAVDQTRMYFTTLEGGVMALAKP